MTRYELIRESIAYFASSAKEQLTCDLGADEAVNDLPYPLEYILYCGELSPAEAALIQQFNDCVSHYCSRPGVKPWHDEQALFDDTGWADIRKIATDTLAQLPKRTSGSDCPNRNGS